MLIDIDTGTAAPTMGRSPHTPYRRAQSGRDAQPVGSRGRGCPLRYPEVTLADWLGTDVAAVGNETGYGMGLQVDTRYCVTVVQHGGGQQADVEVVPAAATYYEKIATTRKLLDVPVDPDVAAGLTSSYDNAALGELAVRRAKGKLDFGEWKSKVASRESAGGSVSMVTISSGISRAGDVIELAVGNEATERSAAVVPGSDPDTQCMTSPSRSCRNTMVSEDVTALAHELPDAELVFAFVSPLGTPYEDVQEALSEALREHGYEVEVTVQISRLLDEMQEQPDGERPEQRQERLMEAGNELRRTHGGDYLALTAIAAINASRTTDTRKAVVPHKRRAHIIRSLKHPDEVVRLRHVYGKGFFLIGVSAPRRLRQETLSKRNFPRDEANRLLDKDAAEEESIGQQTRDTFELADAYLRVDGGDTSAVRAKVRRTVDLLMSCPFHAPTQEEHAMFMAYAAALRSSDLSRQVGAVVANERGDVVASGANDAPAPTGGTYWPPRAEFDNDIDATGGPDYLRGYDSNERERNKILAGVIAALVPDEGPASGNTSSSEWAAAMSPTERAALIKKYKQHLEGTGVLDLTEFGRAVHAEMAALMSCARSGVAPAGGTLYCTTFPCHNCAKHIVAAGISAVVYVEPYPKSKAKDLHADSISLPDEDEEDPDGLRVQFRAFEGIGPRRFVDLFSLALGSGRPVRRKQKDADGARIAWKRGEGSHPRLPLDPRSYLEREDDAAKIFRQKQAKSVKLPSKEDADGTQAAAAKNPDPQGSS